MQKDLRVAIVAAPFGEIGGPELSAIQLADALVDKGVNVSLFAPANFRTKAKIIPTLGKELSNLGNDFKMSAFERRNLVALSQMKVLEFQDKFDVIHVSCQQYGYVLGSSIHKPMVITLHNPMNPHDYAFLKETGITTIALTAKYKEHIGADEHIYPGIPLDKIQPNFEKGEGLIFVGRITDQKGVHVAIEIAQKARKNLTIVGRVGKSVERREYFEKQIQPHIDNKSVTFIGEISNIDLMKLVAKSEALLFPIIRTEPFGRVSIEAWACGTPVIGTGVDPLPEILKNKKAAFFSDNIDELVLAAKNTDFFDRKECRRYAESEFDINLSADKHIELYKRVIGRNHFGNQNS